VGGKGHLDEVIIQISKSQDSPKRQKHLQHLKMEILKIMVVLILHLNTYVLIYKISL